MNPPSTRLQRTLKRPITYSGIGIHTGKQVQLNFIPAEVGSGINFKRIDLPGKPIIPASLDYVVDTTRSTTLGIGTTKIHTVEHVLAAIKAFSIDNLIIEISNIEPAVGNGSSDVFVTMIEESGIMEQSQERKIIYLKNPVYWSENSIHLVALPSIEYRISYTLNYPDSSALRAQFYSFLMTSEGFKNEIAPCRTFSLYEEVEWLMDRGLIKGGSLDNAVVVKDNVFFSKDGLKFTNEAVRHKILDLIGDLSLVNLDFRAHIIAICAGHMANCAFGKKMLQALTK